MLLRDIQRFSVEPEDKTHVSVRPLHVWSFHSKSSVFPLWHSMLTLLCCYDLQRIWCFDVFWLVATGCAPHPKAKIRILKKMKQTGACSAETWALNATATIVKAPSWADHLFCGLLSGEEACRNSWVLREKVVYHQVNMTKLLMKKAEGKGKAEGKCKGQR